MAKFHGRVGFGKTEFDPESGISKFKVIEKVYSGDVLRNTRQWERSEGVNDNIIVKNRISILADPFAYDNLSFAKYVEWLGNLWSISSYEVEYPRIILTLGGVYNGEQA